MNADQGTSGNSEPVVGERYAATAGCRRGDQSADQTAGAARVMPSASAVASALNTRLERLTMTRTCTPTNDTPINWSTSTPSSVRHASSDALAIALSGAIGTRIA